MHFSHCCRHGPHWWLSAFSLLIGHHSQFITFFFFFFFFCCCCCCCCCFKNICLIWSSLSDLPVDSWFSSTSTDVEWLGTSDFVQFSLSYILITVIILVNIIIIIVVVVVVAIIVVVVIVIIIIIIIIAVVIIVVVARSFKLEFPTAQSDDFLLFVRLFHKNFLLSWHFFLHILFQVCFLWIYFIDRHLSGSAFEHFFSIDFYSKIIRSFFNLELS